MWLFSYCYGLLEYVPGFSVLETMILQNNLTCTFIKSGLHVHYYYKVEQVLLKSGAVLMYYKVGQVLLQSGLALLYYQTGQVILQSTAGITKWAIIKK